MIGTTYDGAYNVYLGDSGTENIYEVPYNKTAVFESMASKNIQTLGSTAVYQYDQLRDFATLKCSSALMHPNTPCDASGTSPQGVSDTPNRNTPKINSNLTLGFFCF